MVDLNTRRLLLYDSYTKLKTMIGGLLIRRDGGEDTTAEIEEKYLELEAICSEMHRLNWDKCKDAYLKIKGGKA